MKSKIKVITSEHKTPYILVVGAKEQEENAVCVRFRADSGKQQQTMPLSAFKAYISEKTTNRALDL